MLFERSPQSQITPPPLNDTAILSQFAGFLGRKSTFLAGFASISIHGLVIILLPYISDSEATPTPQLPRPIQVVELTPTEQSRIPILAVPRTSVDTLPAILYQPVLPIPPKRTQAGSSNLSSDWLNRSPSPTPKLATPQPSPKESSDYSLYTKPIFPGNFSVKSSSPSPSSLPSPPSPSPSPSPSSPSSLPSPPSSPSLFPVPEVEINSENPTFPNSLMETPVSESTPPVEDNSSQLSFNPSNTSEENGDTNYQNWATRLKISSTKFQKVFVNGTYPEIACNKKLNGEVAVAVLIDPNQQPNYPEIVKSSGYQVFDEQAITDTMAANLDEAIVGEAHIVIVKYEHNPTNCDSPNSR